MGILKRKINDTDWVVPLNGKCNNFTPNEEYDHLISCHCCDNDNDDLCYFCIHNYNGKRRANNYDK